jgi:TolB-like protein
MSPSKGEAAAPKKGKKPFFRAFLTKLRKRKIIETLAAFIGGGWLLIEVVERLLVGHYRFPEETIDLTVISVIGALLSTLVWRWFRSTEKRPGNVKIEVLLIPLIILATLAIDLNIVLDLAGVSGMRLVTGIITLFLGIAWIIFKSLQWAALAPALSPGQGKRGIEISPPAPAKPEKSIVVLPFANISPEEGQDYFCDGITEEIIIDLSHVHGLLVISRSSAMTFKGTKKTIPEIAGAVNVRYVLKGSVRKAGNNLRIAAQLIDSSNDAHLWSEKYTGTLDDMFDIQEKVSGSIVDALRLTLTPDEKQRITEHPINNPLAYEYYLKARQEILKFTEEGMNHALQYLQNGLDIVGENALLCAGMGYVYYQDVNVGLKTDEFYLTKAEQYAKKVFELDPESPYGHLVLGLLKICWKDSKEGIRHLKRVLAINPDDFDGLYWLSAVYAMIGKKEAAEPLTERLMKIDPLNPAVHFFPG